MKRKASKSREVEEQVNKSGFGENKRNRNANKACKEIENWHKNKLCL